MQCGKYGPIGPVKGGDIVSIKEECDVIGAGQSYRNDSYRDLRY